MSAPIPSFFKIRCVLVIISLLLFFMLIGMTRRAFALDCTYYDYGIAYYKTIAAAQAARNAALALPNVAYSAASASTNLWGICYGITPPGLNIYVFYHTEVRDGKSVQVGSAYVADGSCDDGPDSDGECECKKEKDDLASQCGATGYTMVDEDTCSGRCNDCIAEAEAQCPEPSIIVWNEDGDCSYNCSGDADGDGWPDIDDPDDDNDGIDDDDDPCPTDPDPACEYSPPNVDTDGDGTPDREDDDDDGDGILDSEDDDDDGDGVKDVSDFDADIDGDGLLNWEDDDDDGDGIPDVDDPDADPDGDGKTNDEDDDDDNDGVPDLEDPDNDKYKSDEPAYTFLSTIGEQFSERLTSFINEMKSSSIFSIPSQIFGSGGIPTGGSPFVEFDGGETFGGQQVIDLSNWSSGLAVMRSALYVLFAAVAIKIALTGR